MTKFWELLEESVIIQGTLALATTGAVIYEVVAKGTVTQELLGGWLLILGFFFGSKGQVQVQKAVKTIAKE